MSQNDGGPPDEIRERRTAARKTNLRKEDGNILAGFMRPVVTETLDRGEAAAGRVISKARRDADRTLRSADYRARAVMTHTADEASRVAREVDERVTRQQELAADVAEDILDNWRDKNTELADAVLDRVLAVALAAVVGYGAYFFGAARNAAEAATPFEIAVLFWMGMTLLSGVVFLLYAISGRRERLRNLLKWELYIVVLATVGVAVLFGMRLITEYV